MLDQAFFLGRCLEALMKNEMKNTGNLSVLVPSVLELFFYAKDCSQEKKLFSLIQAEISRAAIENSQATSREKYNSQIVLSNILT